jgi:hypothetical protein
MSIKHRLAKLEQQTSGNGKMYVVHQFEGESDARGWCSRATHMESTRLASYRPMDPAAASYFEAPPVPRTPVPRRWE